MFEQAPKRKQARPEGLSKRSKVGFKTAEGLTGLITLLYAASAVDAYTHGETQAGNQQLEDTARMGAVTGLLRSAEWYLNKNSSQNTGNKRGKT